jgi:hypothetical protein
MLSRRIRTRPETRATDSGATTREPVTPLDRVLTALIHDRTTTAAVRQWAQQLLVHGEPTNGAVKDAATAPPGEV